MATFTAANMDPRLADWRTFWPFGVPVFYARGRPTALGAPAAVYAPPDVVGVALPKAITGVVRGPDGEPFPGGAAVLLFREFDDLPVARATSDAQGRYTFPRAAADPYGYYVFAYTTDPPRAAVTTRGQRPQ